MNYAAPKGWIEVLPRSGEGSQHSTFHLRQDCERIKDRDQVRRLEELGCQLLQGFCFSKPLPAPEIAGLLDGPGIAAA